MTIPQKDYYSILQIPSEADAEDIKVSFRRLARKYHPDLNPGNPETAERFKQISEAYDILSDPTRRRRYDRDRRLGKPKAQVKRDQKKSRTASPRPQAANPDNQNARDFFLQGMKQSKGKHYQQAVKAYSKAIELDPKFIDAYLKRCEMRYKLGDNQGVLDDCHRVIQIDRDVPKAHYYQGRARFSLGYTKPAIESYNEAIRHEQDYAQAYYYRGIAHQDSQENSLAMEDWQIAAELFRTEGNYGAYRLTKKKMNALSKGVLNLGFATSLIAETISNSLNTITTSLINPVGGLLPAFTRLSTGQALATSLVYGIVADACLTGSSYLLAGRSFQFLPAFSSLNVLDLVLVNFSPFILLIFASSFIRAIERVQGNLSLDFFLAGTSFLPLSLTALLIGFVPNFSGIVLFPLIGLLIFGFSYTILTLYANCTQIWQLPEDRAGFYVPLMLMFALFGHYLATIIFA